MVCKACQYASPSSVLNGIHAFCFLVFGDVVVMGGEARLAYHGVDRIRSGSSTLLPKGGRLNLTLRVVV